MCVQIIGPVEDFGACADVTAEGPAGNMLVFEMADKVSFSGERFWVGASNPSALQLG